MEEFYFVISRVRDYIKQKGFHVTTEVIEGTVLNKIIADILDKAIAEAKAQNRDILRVEDFKVSTDGSFVPYDRNSLNARIRVNSLYIKSKVKQHIESRDCKSSSDVLDGGILNKIISDLLDNAIAKAMADNRKLIGRIDFE